MGTNQFYQSSLVWTGEQWQWSGTLHLKNHTALTINWLSVISKKLVEGGAVEYPDSISAKRSGLSTTSVQSITLNLVIVKVQ